VSSLAGHTDVGHTGTTAEAEEPLIQTRLEDYDTLVITKTRAGFDAVAVEEARRLLREAAGGKLGRLKYLVFEFAHGGEAMVVKDEGFNVLVDELSNLILSAPVISVAYARGVMAGADLEFALACSMLVADPAATFSLEGDPVISIGAYGLLAMKIGFVRAERLMEDGGVLDAVQMHDLLLVKGILDEGLEGFLRQASRRHNSQYGIYRAQRINTRSVHASLRG